jgi:nucleotide-binding universal stress UspA family protein
MLALKTIVVATDFSEVSARALDHAIELARPFDARIVLVHVCEVPVFGFPDGALIATSDMAVRITDGAKVALGAAVEQRKSAGVPIEGMLKTGEACAEIHAVASAVGADLIVIGTHARRGLAHALLGSVAEKIVRTATVPVLTIHGPRRDG